MSEKSSTFIEQARTRNEFLGCLHGPSDTRSDWCKCGKDLCYCGTWTDMQTIAALLDVAKAAQGLVPTTTGAKTMSRNTARLCAALDALAQLNPSANPQKSDGSEL